MASTIARAPTGERLDHLFIVDTVEPGSRVLDLGCGRGVLLKLLVDRKNVRGTGVEIAEERVYEAVAQGLSVYHGDIDEGLSDYPAGMFDYVIISQTLQQARRTVFVMEEVLRVGRRIVVSLPNFAHWKARAQLLVRGRAPVTKALPYEWYDTPNIHSVSIKDFRHFAREHHMRIVRDFYLGASGEIRIWPNLRAENAVFVVERVASQRG